MKLYKIVFVATYALYTRNAQRWTTQRVCPIFFSCGGFANRGKVTVTPYREIPKNVGEIIKISKEK